MKISISAEKISITKRLIAEKGFVNITFGTSQRGGFNCNIRDYKLEYIKQKYCTSEVSTMGITPLYSLCTIEDKELLLAKCSNESMIATKIDIEDCELFITTNNCWVCIQTDDIKTILKTSKLIIQLINSSISPVEISLIDYGHPSIFRLNSENLLEISGTYYFTKFPVGQKCLIYIDNNKMYIISQNVMMVQIDIFGKNGSVMKGYLTDTGIFLVDLLFNKGSDMRKHKFSLRNNILVELCKDIYFLHAEQAQPISAITEKDLRKGVMFFPNNKNYKNNKTYIYQTVSNVRINLSIQKKAIGDFFQYELFKDNELFTGSKEFPTYTSFPITKKDLDWITCSNATICEFGWLNNNLVPYKKSKRVSQKKYVDETWNIINAPNDLKIVFKHLKKMY